MVPGNPEQHDDPVITDWLRRDGIICRFVRSPGGYASQPHRHIGTGLLYCQDGRGTFSLGDRTFPYTGGTLVLFDSRVPHHVTMHTTYVRWDVCFLPETLALPPGGPAGSRAVLAFPPRGAARVFQVSESDAARFNDLFANLQREAAERQLGHERMIALHLAELQVLLERLKAAEGPAAGRTGLSGREGRAVHHLADAILQYVEEHLPDPLSVESIAERFHYNPSQIYRIITKVTGTTPTQYLKARRLARARLLLAESDLTVTDVAHAVGFASVSHFCRLFRHEVGCTPSDYRMRSHRPGVRPLGEHTEG